MAVESPAFHLKWSCHHSVLVSVLDAFMKREKLVDVTLAADGQFVNCHRMVLYACSPYFETVLSQYPEDKPAVVFLQGVKFLDLQALVEYMYQGEVNIAHNQLESFLKIAQSFQIKGLVEKDEERKECVNQNYVTPLHGKSAGSTVTHLQPMTRSDPVAPRKRVKAVRTAPSTVNPELKALPDVSLENSSPVNDVEVNATETGDANREPLISNVTTLKEEFVDLTESDSDAHDDYANVDPDQSSCLNDGQEIQPPDTDQAHEASHHCIGHYLSTILEEGDQDDALLSSENDFSDNCAQGSETQRSPGDGNRMPTRPAGPQKPSTGITKRPPTDPLQFIPSSKRVNFSSDSGGFYCPNENCSRRYKNQRSLKLHMKLECGVEPAFRCPLCPYRAKRKAHLSGHLFSIHNIVENR